MVGSDSSQLTHEFLKNSFREYYENVTMELPDRFGRREFAFVRFGGKGMIRHLSFPRKSRLLDYLQQQSPAHVYYSSAYYQKPDAPTMQEKEWMGAELIFDLDSDHLPHADRLSYMESLDLVKKEFKKLVEEFLLGDFGFGERDLDLYFSGGRGYHCHVKDPVVFDLDSNERRELVDYITGQDFQDSIVFREQVTGKKQYGRQSFASGKTLKMPSPAEAGWKGRISRGIIDLVDEIKNSEDPVGKLEEYGVKKSDAERLIQDLSEERVKRIRNGLLDQSKLIRRFFLNRALRKTAVSLGAGETDEPVTCDVKRLIRLPSSLHGKTGLKVEKVTVDGLKDFDPLRDAVVFGDDPVTIRMHQSYTISMNNEEFRLSEGEQDVPLFVAVFVLGRKIAEIKT